MNTLTDYPFRKIPMTPRTVKRIFGTTTRWVVQGAVMIPFTAVSPAHAITFPLRKHFPELAARVIINIYSANGDKCYWIYDEDEFIKKGYWCFQHPQYIARAYRQWQQDARGYYRFLRQLENRGIKQLPKDFEKFYSLYLREYSTPLCTEYYSLGGDDFVRKLLLKYGVSTDIKQWIEILTKPPKLSFLQRAELACLHIALQMSKQKQYIRTVQQLQKRSPAVLKRVQKLQQDFFWIHNSYRDTQPLSVQFFFKKVVRLRKQYGAGALIKKIESLEQYSRRVVSEKKKVMRIATLTMREMQWLQAVGNAASWQDARKQANLIGSYWENRFLHAARRTLHWSYPLMQYMLPQELIAALSGVRTITPAEAKKRRQGSFYAVFPTGEEIFITGAQSHRLAHRVLSANVPSTGDTLRGIGASAGTYRGRVRKIESPIADGHKLRSGDILLTYMTRPDFVPLMHRAGAIVTDEGGLTSHAAIISREMKIPCVVGTRFAMRVLRDGDVIEVDGVAGVITKIN